MPTQGGEWGERVTETSASAPFQELLHRLEEARTRLEEIDDPEDAKKTVWLGVVESHPSR